MKYRLEALADKPEDEDKLEQMLRAEDAFFALSRILKIIDNDAVMSNMF